MLQAGTLTFQVPETVRESLAWTCDLLQGRILQISSTTFGQQLHVENVGQAICRRIWNYFENIFCWSVRVKRFERSSERNEK